MKHRLGFAYNLQRYETGHDKDEQRGKPAEYLQRSGDRRVGVGNHRELSRGKIKDLTINKSNENYDH